VARSPWKSRSRLVGAVVIGAVTGIAVGWMLVRLLLV
jgi:hypothetical protein